jgi:hypothetical protein
MLLPEALWRRYDDMKHQPYVSYLVRFWREDSEEAPEDGWRGEVESVQTGQKWRLHSLNDFMQFIQAQVEVHTPGFSESNQGS